MKTTERMTVGGQPWNNLGCWNNIYLYCTLSVRPGDFPEDDLITFFKKHKQI